jgi:DnaA family protein
VNTPRQLPLGLAFNPRHDFAHFHASVNGEIVSHLRLCARGEGESFIFLHGEVGQGKTHLLHACCADAHSRGRGVAYLPLADVRAYGPEVLDDYEQRQLLCLDDADAVTDHPAWEHALFDLFNRVRDSGGSLIVASRHSPSELPVKLNDLKTRLAWGLTLRLRPLDEDDTLAALTLHARELGLELPAPVARFLLLHCRRDLATLQRLLKRLDVATLTAKRKLTVPFIKAYLEENP